MPKSSTLPPEPNHFQYAPSFIGTYKHLLICHCLCPTDFQHPPPRPHFSCFQRRFLLALVNCHVLGFSELVASFPEVYRRTDGDAQSANECLGFNVSLET